MPTQFGTMNPREILSRYGAEAAVYAILTGNLGSSKVQPDVADRYLREAIERTVIINEARRLPMTSDKRNIDRLIHSGRVLVAPGEGNAPTLAGAIGFEQRQLSVVRLVAAEDWTQETLEDNIEGNSLQDTLIDVMSQMFGRDMEELFLYANTDDVATPAWPDADQAGDAFRQILAHDGWLLSSDNLIDKLGAQPASAQDVFKELLDAIPVKVLDSIERSAWRFYVSSTLERKYREEIGARSTTLGDRALIENIPMAYQGIPVVVVPNLRVETRDFGAGDVTNVTDCLLVVRGNLVTGFRRDVEVDMEKKPRTGMYELTITARGDAEVEAPDSYATMINVQIPA